MEIMLDTHQELELFSRTSLREKSYSCYSEVNMLLSRSTNLRSIPVQRKRVVLARLRALCLFTTLLFCQLWFDVAGFTIRAEDALALGLLGLLLLQVLITGKLRYYRNPLNLPLVLWCAVLLMGVGITLLSPFADVTKKDALVNGIRLVLAVGMFFVVTQHPAPAERKLKAVMAAVVGFSLITTAVALLQIGHWDGWLPFRLPSALITFKEGANTAQGREIFALYLGDTGSHTWSGALAMQALLVWLVGSYAKYPWRKWAAWLYFGLLTFILIRISVRNSILGLFVAMVGLGILRGQTRYLVKRILRLAGVMVVVVVLLYALFYVAPDTYFIERIRQAVPRFENGELVIERGSNVHARLDYWAAALKMFASSPLTGKGFYSYKDLSGLFLPGEIVHAHNSYLQTLAELGLIGAVALGWLMLNIGRYVYRSRRYFKLREPGRLWWEFATGSFLFLAFTALFGVPFTLPIPFAFRMIVLGVLVSLVRERIC